MANQNCKYANVTNGKIEKFITCGISGKFCKHQRFCTTKNQVLNTDDYLNCEILKENNMEENVTNSKQKATAKNGYKVVLVANDYIVYEKDGKNLFKNGHFDVKIGDYIAID